jgi:uncharacterized protein
MSMQVEVVRAWPRRHESVMLEVPPGATVSAAIAASGFDLGDIEAYAVFGERVAPDAVLHDGDRVELLPPLQVGPKEARRQRAQKTKT